MVDKVAYAPLPHFEEGKSTSCLGGYQYGINASSKNPEAAYKLVQFLSSEEIQLKSLASRRVPAPLATRMRAPPLRREPVHGAFMSLKDIFTASTPRPIHPAYPQMSLAMQSGLSGALANQMGVQEALDSIAPATDRYHFG